VGNKTLKRPNQKIKNCKPKSVCHTQWCEWLEALETMVELHSLVLCLEIIISKSPQQWPSDSVIDAKGFLVTLTSAYFIVPLTITINDLKGLTSSL
jgi:antibiotic biosynthesis monooxygenase (ABM) superfamily enzyme